MTVRSPGVTTPAQRPTTQAAPRDPVDQAIARFANRHGVRLELTPNQRAALQWVLTQEHGEARAEAYLGLAAHGVGMTLPQNRQRLIDILDVAVQVGAGRNVKAEAFSRLQNGGSGQ